MNLQECHAFSGVSVNDITAAKNFYGSILGFTLEEENFMGGGMFGFTLGTGGKIFVYQKDDHQPATYTVLNFPVDNIDVVVDDLTAKGVVFELYDGFMQDEKGIARSSDQNPGPNIAWFTDPAGNILSVLQ